MKQIKKMTVISLASILLSLFFGMPESQAKEKLIHPEVGFLIVAPDRGFLGNEEVRDVVADFSKEYASALTFATSELTLENLSIGIDDLKAKKVEQIWVLPLFISPANALYQKAIGALKEKDWGLPLKIGETMNKSYLVEELLKDRIKALSKSPSKEVMMLIAHGAGDEAGAKAMREDLEALLKTVNKSFHFRETEVLVLYNRDAEETLSDAAFDNMVERIALNRGKGDRVVVVPFNFGMKMTHMMAQWNWIKRSLSKYDKIVSNGLGILPHKNVGHWLRNEANQRLPLSDDAIGVVLMPHGSSYNWNETMRKNLKPLLDRHMIEYAFSMADPKVMERAVKKLEDRGARAIIVVRIFSLAASFKEKTEYILGLNPQYRRGGRTMRISSPAVFTTIGGVERDPLMAQVMLERAVALSKNPGEETIILLGHGTDSEERNQHWLDNLAALSDEMKKNGGKQFRNILYDTWREDWADKREEAVDRIRKMIVEASKDGGTAIVVPERTAGQGHGEKFFKGLSYRYGTGFSPHPNFMKWVEQQIEQGKAELYSKVREAGETEELLVSAQK